MRFPVLYRRPDEPGSGGAGNNTPPTNPSITDDTVIDVAGQKMTVKELREGGLRLQDYTRKTQEVARRRDEVQVQQAEVENEKTYAERLAQAVDADVEWYRNHSLEEWGAYTPQVAVVKGQVKNPNPNPNPPPASTSRGNAPMSTDPALIEKLTKIEQTVEAEAKERKNAVVRQELDKMFNHLDAELKKHPLADEEMVYNRIQVFQANNKGQLPTLTEVSEFVKDVHQRFEKKGARIPDGVVPPEGSRKTDGVPPGTPGEVKPPVLNLKEDREKVSDALTEFLLASAKARGG